MSQSIYPPIVQGDTAHDAVDVGNPVKIGGKARSAVPTNVADNDRVQAYFDRAGRLIETMKSGTAALTNIAASASNVLFWGNNADRQGGCIYNDSTATLYLKLGTTASATSFTVLMVGGAYYELPAGYFASVSGIWDSATGSARVTEIS